MKPLSRALLLLAAVVYASRAGADVHNIRFSNISADDGLPGNAVGDVLHDSRGFMWIGTRKGVCRYDGYDMRVYGHDPEDRRTLQNDIVKCIFEDSRGRLWVGTEGGPVRYDRKVDRFERIETEGQSEYILTGFIETGGAVYLSSFVGVFRFDEDRGVFVPLYGAGERSPLPLRINDMAKDDGGTLWLATPRGVWLLDPSRPDGALALSLPAAEQRSDPSVLTVARDGRGRMWFGKWNGIRVYDPAAGEWAGRFSSAALGDGAVRAIEFDLEGNAWIGGENGLDIVSPAGEVRHISRGSEDVTGISDNSVYVVHRDRDDNMWVGTYFGGVNVLFRNKLGFYNYYYGFSDRHLSGKAVRQIVADGDDALWVATEDGGLNRLDRSDRRFTHHTGREGGIALNFHNVHSLLEDSRGDLWIGTFTGGVNLYHPRSGRTEWPRIVSSGRERDMIYSLVEDGDGDVWIGTTHGLFVRRAGRNEIEPADITELSEAFIFSMACDAGGLIWIGTRNGGLFCMDKSSGALSRVPGTTAAHNFVTTIAIDESDDIWAGTNNGGVIRLDRATGRVSLLTVEDGLPSNSIMGIVCDDNGRMWISTNRGLCSLADDLSHVRTYTKGDGLPTNMFNYGSAFRASRGELYFGTVDGMISFYPDSVDLPRPRLKVEFTEMRTEGRRTTAGEDDSPLEEDITQTSSVRLTWRQASSVGFGFTALNFSYAADIRYAIRMDGASPRWQEVGREHSVLFPRLGPGRHTLSVKASYDGVEWDEEGTRSIDIQVMPPFPLSVWAMAIYVALAAGAAVWVWLFARSRMRLRRKMDDDRTAKLQAEEMNRQKTVFFGNISHDLKTPLALILGPLQRTIADRSIDPETRDTLSVALRNTRRMKNLLEELVTMSKIEMNHLKVVVQQGDVLEFIDRMCDIFRVFAGETGVDFVVSIDRRKGRKVWFSPTDVERVIYNLLSNAFKFTPDGGMIRIGAWLYDGADGRCMLGIDVKDTGEGIPPSEHEKIFENYYTTAGQGKHKGAGIGLALTRSLVSLYNGDISLESAPGQGALFRVRIDVDRKSYTEDQISHVPVETTEKLASEYIDDSSGYLRQARIEIQIDSPKRSRILVVEDNRELSDFVGQMFSGDFDVLSAYDGAEGYDMAIREMPDIIISDIVMPQMDGLEMTRRLKGELMASHIPVVLLTARSEESEKVEGFECGADAYIEKPFNPQRLELQIRNLLNTRRRNVERFKHGTAFDAKRLTHNPRDEKFLSSVVDVIMKNMGNENFSVREITDALCVSRSLLHMKLKKLVDLSVTEFVRNIRMKEARERLSQGMNVSEASYAVGISDPNYFSKCFKKQFGQTPSDFIRTTRSGR